MENVVRKSLTHWKVTISKRLKQKPSLFDAARRTTRILGIQSAVYGFLAEVTRNLPEIGFIQIGSNDGISIDPLREFIVSDTRWHGAFVEPVPQLFERLKRNYAYIQPAKRNLIFINAAVSDQSGSYDFWKIRDEFLHEFPLFAYQIGSLDRSHVVKHFPEYPGLENRIECIRVPCMTYRELRGKANLDRVDVLHVDAEGRDGQILKTLDYEAQKPLAIVFEISNMPHHERRDIAELLGRHGYQLKEGGIDCFATLKPQLAVGSIA
jgi:FkbM family methyltransferase